MKERAAEIGATLAIESETGNGCRVVVVWEHDEESMTNNQ